MPVISVCPFTECFMRLRPLSIKQSPLLATIANPSVLDALTCLSEEMREYFGQFGQVKRCLLPFVSNPIDESTVEHLFFGLSYSFLWST